MGSPKLIGTSLAPAYGQIIVDHAHFPHSDPRRVDSERLQQALNQIVANSLRPLTAGLAVLYVMYTVGHLFFLNEPTATVLASVAGGTAVLLGSVRFYWTSFPNTTRWLQVVGSFVIGVVLLNILLHMGLTGEVQQSTNLMLLLLVVGILTVSTRWFASATAVILGSWAAVLLWVPTSGDLGHYVFAMASTTVLAVLLHVIRSRSVRESERRRIAGVQMQAALEEALASEAEAREALEASNRALEDAIEEAEEMNRLQSTFVADMSHEIRTPLTSIIGFAEVLDEEENVDANMQHFATLIRRSSKRLLETVNSVLDLSKIETGTVELSLAPVNVTAMMDETMLLFAPKAERNEVGLVVDVAPSVYAVADPTALHRVVANLLSNAIKFTGAGGRVELRAGTDEDGVWIEVEDTGAGIDPEFLPHLFDPFQQSEETKSSGTGLGLAITQRLVALMNGRIHVQTTVGEGTCFTVRLQDASAPPDGD